MEALISPQVEGVTVLPSLSERQEQLLTPEALTFLRGLHRQFNSKRKELLAQRASRQVAIKAGKMPSLLEETAYVRTSDWQVAPIPHDLQYRRTEITGPVDRKMIINALNSGAQVFMADFEDATSPTWQNTIEGQINLYDAIRRQIDFIAPNGKQYSLNEDTAVLKVRPRGWHLVEKHLLIDGEPISASLFDFGLYFFHNAHALLDRNSGPYFYLPKLESHEEARLWNEVFCKSQMAMDIPAGTIKVTVLIETILAAFEMEEIIYELRHHMAGLNAGRWDYIFSAIKKFRDAESCLLPDRSQVTMTVPFMRAYAQLLVYTCHKRGAHAIGGMAAFIPSRDAEANTLAFSKVQADKKLEAESGFDGTWVAHPALVDIAQEEFAKIMGDHAHQKKVMLGNPEELVTNLLNFKIEGGAITEAGARMNINVGILYIASWLRGTGAAALYNLMEDAATAEISRAQIWQWLHREGLTLQDGREFTPRLYRTFLEEETNKIKAIVGEATFADPAFATAIELFDSLVTSEIFAEFLTLPAYERLS
ncbi:MAG TPA: malate synthase A [Cytophagales bacterium]|nr:malate synthase A [Cytophagales bacterium]